MSHPVRGRFGPFGGQYVPETLMGALEELEGVWHEAKADPQFQLELAGHRRAFIGRPTPIYAATRLSEKFGGTHIHFKREDLCHTGAHKLNNAVGQALLAMRMGKKRIIAETGAGQHGVATATVCARFGLDCTVYMGTEDMRRQSMNVRRMKLLNSEVREVTIGTRTLKDATSEAIRDSVIETFDDFVSMSIQHLVHEMGQRLLTQFPALAEVSFEAQNRLWDTSRISEADPKTRVFSDPKPAHGMIGLTLGRDA